MMLHEKAAQELEKRRLHLSRISELSGRINRACQRSELWVKETEEFDSEAKEIELSQVYYRKAVDLVYAKSIGELEQIINSALSFVFFDRSYSIKFDLGDQRGKTLELLLLDNSEGRSRTIDMKDGVGNGVRSVVSFVLLTLHLTSRGIPPILFLDEAYSAISESYVDRFFTFARGLSLTKQAPIVLISHDDRFLPYADQKIRVSDGVVQTL
jgi:hypothetical protein